MQEETKVPSVVALHALAVYEVIVLPDAPLLDGAAHDTNVLADRGAATTFCGADGPGSLEGVTDTRGLLAGEFPALFLAVTST